MQNTKLIDIKKAFSDKTLLVIAPQYPDPEHYFIGGIFIQRQIEPMKPFFYKIVVIAPVLRNIFSKEYKYCQGYSYDNVTVHYPRCWYIPRPVHKILSKYMDMMVDNRWNVVETLIERRKIHFDLIHAHFTWPSGYIASRLKEKYRVPFVLSLHEDPVWFREDIKRNHPLWKNVWTQADALIRINKEELNTLKQFNPSLFSIKYGFSREFAPQDREISRKKLNWPFNKKIIFSLGFLTQRKGFNFLIDAMSLIKDQRNDVVCYIGGADPSGLGLIKYRLQKQISLLGLQNDVVLMGPVPDTSIVTVMNACDLFVFPSLSEAFGIVNLEAIACGKPVVSTNNGGSNEIVTSDTYGFLVEPADPNALAKKILEALDIKWNSSLIRQHAEKYSWDAIAEQTIGIYDKVILNRMRIM